jgi:dihydroflavonol-4-reductase
MPESKADLVLLTGISGFLGGHLALQLLAAGYRVRGSVRSAAKGEKVRATLGRHGADLDRLEIVGLELTNDHGWDAAMAGVRYLQHTASPFVTSMPRDRNELIGPAVAGAERALGAALRAGAERVVLTSSMAAVAYGYDRRRTAPFTAADWTRLDGRDVNPYAESKLRAERRAWELMDAAGRHADLVSINPGAILGPLLDDDPGTSAALLIRLIGGSMPAAPRLSFTFVDVRDVAAAHVRAMTAEAAGGQRFLMGSAPLTIIELAGIVGEALPERAGRLPRFVAPDWVVRLLGLFDRDVAGTAGELGVVKRIEPGPAEALLGRPLIPAREAIAATARSLVAEGLV